MQQLIAELTNYQNAIIMFVTWMGIEVMSPLVRATIMHARLLPYRLKLHNAVKYGKRIAAVVWCSGIVWIPHAQPELCQKPVVEGVEVLTPEGCQSIFTRVAIGVILGGLLSSGHWAGAIAYRKLTGRKKKVWVKCVNCDAKVEVESLDDPCPKCNEPPHEVTSSTRRS